MNGKTRDKPGPGHIMLKTPRFLSVLIRAEKIKKLCMLICVCFVLTILKTMFESLGAHLVAILGPFWAHFGSTMGP
jgi:hypothetical protein